MIYRFDPFQADDEAFRLTSGSTPVPLEPKTLRLLLFLLQNPGRLLRKQEILDAVWADTAVTENALTRSIGLLRKALDDDSRQPRFIETVPAVGYRFIADVEVFSSNRETTSPRAPSSPRPRALGDQQKMGPPPSRLHRSLAWTTAAIATPILLIVVITLAAHSFRSPKNAIHSLAVLPLDNLSGDASQDYFAEGMTDELITELARIPSLRVVSRTSVIPQKNSRKSLPEIARELNVDAVVEGSTVRSGDRVRITAQLIDGRTDQHLWAQSFEGPAADVLSLQDSVAQQIAQQASLILIPVALRPPVNPAAHDAYLRGRYFFNKQDFAHSLEYYQQAISLDPNYASAFAGYATALEASSLFGGGLPADVMPKAFSAAQHAVQLDPQNGEAYTELGSIQTVYYWDWPAAQQNLTRGIALSPSDPIAEFKYSVYLDATGHPQEAVAHMRRAVDLDPLSFFMVRRLGVSLYLARDYDAALAQLNRAAEMEHQPESIDNYLSLVFEHKGMLDDAVDHDLAALQVEHPQLDAAALRSIYQKHGWQPYWRARTQAYISLPAGPCTPYFAGAGYLRAGDLDRSFSAFNQALDQHCPYNPAVFKVDPVFDSVRTDPRYRALLRRLNLR